MVRVKNSIDINDYFLWLCDIVHTNSQDGSYFLLINDLYNKEFHWFVPNDDNRAFEGRNLREQFCDEMNIEYNYEDFDMEVSMLELIIGLAYRCESIMADQDANVQMDQWFWHILGNIDLDKFRDESYYDLGGSAMVNNILDRVINRTYYRSGKGGLFPLKYSKKDQRDVELWYQMSSYLVENYYNIDYKIV